MEHKQIKHLYASYSKKLIALFDFPLALCRTFNDLAVALHQPEHEKTEFVETINKYEQLQKELFTQITDHFETAETTSATAFFDDFSIVEDHISAYSETTIEIQSQERFLLQREDSFRIKLGKLFKHSVFRISKLPLKTKNLFLRLFRKEPQKINYWKHKIYTRRLARYVYLIVFLEKLSPVLKFVFENRREILLKIQDIDKQMGGKVFQNTTFDKNNFTNQVSDIEQNISNIQQEITTRIETIAEKAEKKYHAIYEKAGTFEYPSRKIRVSYLEKQQKQRNKKLRESWQLWHNKVFCQFEYWRLQHETRRTLLFVSNTCQQSIAGFKSKIIREIIPTHQTVISTIETALNRLPTTVSGNKEITVQTIDNEINHLDKSLLNNSVPAFINTTVEQDLQSVFDEIRQKLRQFIDDLPPSKILVRADAPIALSPRRFKKIEVKEIIFEQAFRHIHARLQTQQNTCIKSIDTLISAISEVAQIVEFTSIYFASKEQIDNLDAELKEIRGGIERALSKARSNAEFITAFERNTADDIRTAIRGFRTELNESIVLEKIFDVERKIIRQRQIERNKQRLVDTFSSAKVFFHKVVNLGKRLVALVKARYKSITTLLGFDKRSVSISSEIANYLSETEAAINRLPLIYQKLFKIEPLTHDKFYMPRQQVLNHLENAYRNWLKRKYATTCLVGEKGSGSTTIINFFLKVTREKYAITRVNCEGTIAESSNFLQFLKTIFPSENFNSLDDLIESINRSRKKRIVVIENIQHLFLKKVNGFGNLLALFQLISKTNTHIFWLTSSLVYSWNYLNYAIGIEEYFGYTVKVTGLTNEQIIQIIQKRHRPSGFNLVYLPPASVAKSRRYKRTKDENKQVFLQDNFFTLLNEFTQSNITLALLFWLRSVKKVKGENLYMSSEKVDYSFLDSLALPKVITLHALLLHDGLTAAEHAEVFRWPLQRSQTHLMLLKDDAIVMDNNGIYTINPLLYRQFVNLLKSKNFIH